MNNVLLQQLQPLYLYKNGCASVDSQSAYSQPKIILLNKYFGVVLTSEAISYKLKLGGGGGGGGSLLLGCTVHVCEYMSKVVMR